MITTIKCDKGYTYITHIDFLRCTCCVRSFCFFPSFISLSTMQTMPVYTFLDYITHGTELSFVVSLDNVVFLLSALFLLFASIASLSLSLAQSFTNELTRISSLVLSHCSSLFLRLPLSQAFSLKFLLIRPSCRLLHVLSSTRLPMSSLSEPLLADVNKDSPLPRPLDLSISHHSLLFTPHTSCLHMCRLYTPRAETKPKFA